MGITDSKQAPVIENKSKIEKEEEKEIEKEIEIEIQKEEEKESETEQKKENKIEQDIFDKSDFSSITSVKLKLEDSVMTNKFLNPLNVSNHIPSIMKTVEIGIDGKHIYVGGYDSYPVVVFRIGKPNWADYLVGHTDCTFCIKTNKARKLTISGARDGNLIFWRVYFEGDQMKHEMLHKYTEISKFILSIRITAKGDKVFALSQASDIRMICTSTYKQLRVFKGYSSSFNDQYFCVNDVGSMVVGHLSTNGSCLKIQQEWAKKHKVLFWGSPETFTVCHFVDRFRTLVYGTSARRVEFLDYRTKKKRLVHKTGGDCRSFAYSEARRVLAAGLSSGVCLFQFLKSGHVKVLSVLKMPALTNQTMAMSFCGLRFLSCEGAKADVVSCEYTYAETEKHLAVCL